MAAAERIARLARLAAQPERLIVGLMSGTSLDGLDVALCRIAGAGEATQARLERFHTFAYSAAEQAALRRVVSQPQVALAEVCALNTWLADLHARHVLAALQDWGARADALASHGLTVYHVPRTHLGLSTETSAPADAPAALSSTPALAAATLQLCDGDRLAVRTGLVTISDFRQKEAAGGGEGAPLAPYADALLFRGSRPRVLLNLGGIANFTALPALGAAGSPARSTPGEPICGDTGPANTLLDRAARRWNPAGPGMDQDGALAARGRVHEPLLRALLAHPYFALPCPKSTGPELFGAAYLDGALAASGAAGLPAEDVLATLTRLTVDSIALTLHRELQGSELQGSASQGRITLAGAELIVSGGGRHNRTLLEGLRRALPECSLLDSAVLGVPADAKEALIFAVLANETLCGAGFTARDGSGRRLGFGKISLPD